MTLELTLAPSGAAVATPRHPLAPHSDFLSGALSNSASGFTRTLALDGHLSQGRCRYKAPAPKREGKLTWLSKRPDSRTRRTSKTQDLRRLTWS